MSPEGWVLPTGEVSAEGRLSRRLRSVAVRTFGTCTTAAGDDMIVVELWRAGRGQLPPFGVDLEISVYRSFAPPHAKDQHSRSHH